MEAQGMSPVLVEGASFNFKVTYPQDWALAEAVLNDRKLRPGVLA
jgi:2-C-methyl-D-erythritol 4-phosphate cytidylyltransferase